MARFFLETSALAKRYILEEGTPRVSQLVESGDSLLVSRLALVEVASAAVRRTRAGDIAEDALTGLLQTLDDDFRRRFEVVELGGGTMSRSVDLIRVHALRAADGIQLACALIAAGSPGASSELMFVSSDRELNAAAETEGMTVLDPCRD